MAPFQVLEAQRTELMRTHPGWRVWFVPNAPDGSVTWCARREPTIHGYSPEDLGKDMALAGTGLAYDSVRVAAALGNPLAPTDRGPGGC
jgi:hypothetical protein